jgi:hypothetical protein
MGARPSQARSSQERGSAGTATVLLVLVVAGLLAWAVAFRDDKRPGPERVAAVDLSELRAVSTTTTLRRAPRDNAPEATSAGVVAHPTRMLPLHRRPGGAAFAKIGPRQFGETWLPVVARRDGWVQVLLPSRPNGSAGWLRTPHLQLRTSYHLVRVYVGSRSLELFSRGRSLGSWPIAVGRPDTPTPTGRTFLLGSIVDSDQPYSPVILPLGFHSETLDAYGGGPGTVALHGWPDASVFGTAVSHGCVRVPSEALDQLRQVPLGTLVLIDDR